MRRARHLLATVTTILLGCVAFSNASEALAATIVVKVNSDPVLVGNHKCSLRQAIAAVNSPGVLTPCGRASRSSNVVVLGAGRYRLLVRPSGTDENGSGDLDVTRASSLTLVGAGSTATVIDASGLDDRALSIASGTRVTVSKLAIHGGQALSGTTGTQGTGGVACAPGGAGSAGANGGGIFNAGTLTLRTTVVERNMAGVGGGGGAGGAQTAPAGCSGGTGGAGGSGGGIYNAGRLTLTHSTLTANAAGAGGSGGAGGASSGAAGFGGTGGPGGLGGAVYNEGTLTVTGSFVSGNRAGGGGAGGPGGSGATGSGRAGPGGPGGWGGGVFSTLKVLSLVNSTLVENLAGDGGQGSQGGAGGSGGAVAVRLAASTIVNGTIAHNLVGRGGSSGRGPGASGLGGGMFVDSVTAQEKSRLENTIVASNSAEQCAGTAPSAIANGGHNLSFGDSTCPGVHANPELATARDNGGPTETLALAQGSPAINRVPRNGAHCPSTDQRGVQRPQRGACDIGAFEFAVPQITILQPSNRGSYERGSHVRARFLCNEGGITSPIATCRATVGAGHGIDTRSVGTKQFRVIAVDKTGYRLVHGRPLQRLGVRQSAQPGHRPRSVSHRHGRRLLGIRPAPGAWGRQNHLRQQHRRRPTQLLGDHLLARRRRCRLPAHRRIVCGQVRVLRGASHGHGQAGPASQGRPADRNRAPRPPQHRNRLGIRTGAGNAGNCRWTPGQRRPGRLVLDRGQELQHPSGASWRPVRISTAGGSQPEHAAGLAGSARHRPLGPDPQLTRTDCRGCTAALRSRERPGTRAPLTNGHRLAGESPPRARLTSQHDKSPELTRALAPS